MNDVLMSMLIAILCVLAICNIAPLYRLLADYEYTIDIIQVYYGSPKYIYNNSKLNWFGAVVSFLGLFLLFPVYYLMLGIYWLFHVGRR